MKIEFIKNALDNRYSREDDLTAEQLKEFIETLESELQAETLAALSENAVGYMLDVMRPTMKVEIGINYVKISDSQRGFNNPEQLAEQVFDYPLNNQNNPKAYMDFKIDTRLGYIMAYIGDTPPEV